MTSALPSRSLGARGTLILEPRYFHLDRRGDWVVAPKYVAAEPFCLDPGYVVGYIPRDWTPTLTPPPPNYWFIDHAGNRIELYRPPVPWLPQSRK